MKRFSLFISSILLLVNCFFFTYGCSRVESMETRINKLEADVADLQLATLALEDAYKKGKIIKNVSPLDDANSGWNILFSDNTSIVLTNGTNGITPFLSIDQDGHWCVSYDNGNTFTRFTDTNGSFIKARGDKGEDGISINVIINDDGFYTFVLCKATDPNTVIDTIVTPFNANPSLIITGISEDVTSHLITFTMQDGKTYSFNKTYICPTSIVVLKSKVFLGEGSTSSFEFRVNPSNAVFNYDTESEDCEIALDKIGVTRNSYVSSPSYYKLSSVEQVYDEEGTLKKGQYRAYITDLCIDNAYSDLTALVLSVDNKCGEIIQISSSPVEICYSGNLILDFQFLTKNNQGKLTEDVTATINDNIITLSSPYILSTTGLVANFRTNGEKVFIGNEEQISGFSVNNYDSPVEYKVVSSNNEVFVYKVEVNASKLPVVYINTPDSSPITSKEVWTENSSITIINSDGSIGYSDNQLQIRGRGNSTWGYPKKPYALKLSSKTSVLGMPKHKRWVLLANWLDRTLMRNDVAFQISRQTGLAWTPRGQFVELVLNGKHLGNFYLCEQIKVDENRVNIKGMKASDKEGDAVTGGYLVELDTYFDEVNKFKSAIMDLPYMFKEPDEDALQPEQFSYFENYINSMESALYGDSWLSDRQYTNYLDLDSFVDWWFVYELVYNGEPNHPKSCYMHKDRLGLLKAGPVWDFDWGSFTPHENFAIKKSLYYKRLFQDPDFILLVKSRWNEHKSRFSLIPDYIRTISSALKSSNSINIGMWPINANVNGDDKMTYEDAINRMISSYEQRFQWLDVMITEM